MKWAPGHHSNDVLYMYVRSLFETRISFNLDRRLHQLLVIFVNHRTALLPCIDFAEHTLPSVLLIDGILLANIAVWCPIFSETCIGCLSIIFSKTPAGGTFDQRKVVEMVLQTDCRVWILILGFSGGKYILHIFHKYAHNLAMICVAFMVWFRIVSFWSC